MTAAPPSGRIVRDGRAKAYRPLPERERAAALEAGLSAYARGDFFLAHELLEPAWMGAADPAERDLYQGLIKLAAAFVHVCRGNPTGVVKNLAGARARLRAVEASGAPAGGLDLPGLLRALDRRLSVAERLVAQRSAGGPHRSVRPLPIGAPVLRRAPR